MIRKQYLPSQNGRSFSWNSFWSERDIIKEIYEASVSPVLKLILKWLPNEGRILDAGCGLGGYLISLREKGFDIHGVDSSQTAIKLLKQYDANLSVECSDCCRLRYPSKYFDAYISLGVIEHLENRIDAALREARRVLRPQGILIISVPYINLYRRFSFFFKKRRFFTDEKKKRELVFYQYMFSRHAVLRILSKHKFVIIGSIPYSVIAGMKDIPLFLKLYKAATHGSDLVKAAETATSSAKDTPQKVRPVFFKWSILRKFYRLLSWEQADNIFSQAILALTRECWGHMLFVCAVKKTENGKSDLDDYE